LPIPSSLEHARTGPQRRRLLPSTGRIARSLAAHPVLFRCSSPEKRPARMAYELNCLPAGEPHVLIPLAIPTRDFGPALLVRGGHFLWRPLGRVCIANSHGAARPHGLRRRLLGRLGFLPRHVRRPPRRSHPLVRQVEPRASPARRSNTEPVHSQREDRRPRRTRDRQRHRRSHLHRPGLREERDAGRAARLQRGGRSRLQDR
jgi:hypothetical protein